MIDLKSFLNNHKTQLPEWFLSHSVFSEIKSVKKIFPSIGLDNFSIETNIDDDAVKQKAHFLCIHIQEALRSNLNILDTKSKEFLILRKIINQLDFRTKIYKNKGLYISDDIIVHNKNFAKKGESLFKVYNKISNLLKTKNNINLRALENTPSFKEYSANNIGGNLKIVFSSDDNDGAWDIATMSQRGISSCQSWNGQFKSCIIGSILDPFTAIIYLSSSSRTEFGTKMIRRCVVRFIVDKKTNKPSIYLEYMYPSHNKTVVNAFKEAIRSKIGDKYPILYINNISKNYVPYSSVTPILAKYSQNSLINKSGSHNRDTIFPYRDHFVKYKTKEVSSMLDQEKCSSIAYEIANHVVYKVGINPTLNDVIIKVLYDFHLEHGLGSNIKNVCIKYFANKNKLINDITKKYSLVSLDAKKHLNTFLASYNTTTKRYEHLLISNKNYLKLKKMSMKRIIEKEIMPIISSFYRKKWIGYIKNGS